MYKNHKISMIGVRTLKYSVEGCVFALLAAALSLGLMGLFSFVVNVINLNE